MSKFRITDHVRVTQPTTYWFDQTGVVADIQPGEEYSVFVDLDNGGQVAFRESELILADVVDSQFERNKHTIQDAINEAKTEQQRLSRGGYIGPPKPRDMAEPVNVRAQILRTAEKLINGQRAKDYGDACENFQRIADLWAPILRTPVTAEQVALCMAQVKIARLITSPGHEDSWIDLAGYAALGGEIASDGA